ncbi:MAG: winged helix-turn-helix domain-containing protein [Bacilli bacterium]
MYNYLHVVSQNKELNKNLKYFSRHFKFYCLFYSSIYALGNIKFGEIVILVEPTFTNLEYFRKKSDAIIICIFNEYNQKIILTNYEIGMDDYFIYPFSYVELLYKIRTFSKYLNKLKYDCVKYKNLLIDYNKKKVYIDNNVLNLTYKEFMIIYILIKNINKYISKQELIKLIWNSNEKTRSVDTYVCTLKRKIKPYNINIKNKRNIGYIFTTENE